jgi:hypothetical protein
MIATLSGAEFASDWGTRIISSRDPRYDPGGYHFGSVWPLFTGWDAVGAYRYHRAATGYTALLANAELVQAGSPGHVTEVLSGDYAQELSTSSPHQIWSSAMVISPLLLGLLGLDVNAPEHTIAFAPHAPAEWKRFTIAHVRAGATDLTLDYSRTDAEIRASVRLAGPGGMTLQFSPAISPRARVASVTVNGRPATFRLQKTASDQHVVVQVPLAGALNEVRLAVRDDFGIVMPWSAPRLGDSSRNLKLVSENWAADHNTLTLTMDGVGGLTYELHFRGANALASATGGELLKSRGDEAILRVRVEPADVQYHRISSTLFFAAAAPISHRPEPQPLPQSARSETSNLVHVVP